MNACSLGVLFGLAATLMLSPNPVAAEAQTRVGPWGYTGNRCNGYTGPLPSEHEAASATFEVNYSQGKCWYRLDGPAGPWGEYTPICGAQTGSKAHRYGLEYWAVRRYQVTYSAKTWNSYYERWECTAPLIDGFYLFRDRKVCPPEQIYDRTRDLCVNLGEKDKLELKNCPTRTPNPTLVATGSREYSIDTGMGFAELPLLLRYDSSRRVLPSPNPPPPLWGRPEQLGALWSSSLHRLLVRQGVLGIAIGRHDGGRSSFTTPTYWTFAPAEREANEVLALQQGYGFRDKLAGRSELFDREYRLIEIQAIGGAMFRLEYTTSADTQAIAVGLLKRVSDAAGRWIDFQYRKLWDGDPGDMAVLSGISSSDGRSVSLEYDAGRRLSSVTLADGSREEFFYEDPRHPWAMTRRRNALQMDVAHYRYDEAGNAVEASGAHGANQFSLSYDMLPGRITTEQYDAPTNTLYRVHEWASPQRIVIRNPLGVEQTLFTSKGNGYLHEADKTQPAGSGCAAASSRQAVDAQGNLLWREDFNGQRSCFAHDAARHLELVRVEGLAANASCTPTQSGFALPVGSRKLSTSWHPVWRLPIKQAEPGRITTRVYNGQPDPFAGNAIASCAPTDARLVDGKPIVVLCKEIVQATTDLDGAQGLSPTPDLKVPQRIQRWTYNRRGQILSHDGPRTDVADLTQYEYYEASTADYSLGDLKLVRNALGQETRYPRYTRSGQPLERLDANGIATSYEYDSGQRLLSTSTAGASTRFEYLATGQLSKISWPDGSQLQRHYDGGQRLVGLSDAQGNRIDYLLDQAGNRVEERASDPNWQLRRLTQRRFDALGRLDQLTGLR